MSEQCIPEDLKKRVEKELQPGERVEWLGMPVPRFFSPGALAAFFSGILCTTLSILWALGYASQEKIALDLPMFIVSPFLIFGLGLTSVPIWAFRSWLKTIYIITDKRAITIEAGGASTIRSYSSDMLKHIYIKNRNDGRGDVLIPGRHPPAGSNTGKAKIFGFLRVRDPEEIERRLRKLAEQCK